jgi:hypothetical protein
MTTTNFNIIEQTGILQVNAAFTKGECAEIVRQILAYKAASTKNDDSVMLLNVNRGCWMGRPQENGGMSPDIASLLITKILTACNQYLSHLPAPLNMNTLNTDYLNKTEWYVRAWCNVNEPASENFMHSHPGKVVSGVIYFQAEDTGNIEFVPLNYLHKLSNPAWPYHGTSSYIPADGDMLLFPSYLLHTIHRNDSNKQRINMSFDAIYLEK